MTEENASPDVGSEQPAATAAEASAADQGTILDQAAAPAEDVGHAEGSEGVSEGGEEKPSEGAGEKPEEKAPEGAPEKYEDFKMPEGMTLDGKVSEAFQGAAKELGLSQEKAQGFIDKLAPVLAQQSMERIKAISDGWREKSMKNEEIAKSLPDIARLRDKFAKDESGNIDPDIAEFMNSPMGNHPGCLKLLARAGRAFGEGSYPQGKPVATGYSAEQFYQDAFRGGK